MDNKKRKSKQKRILRIQPNAEAFGSKEQLTELRACFSQKQCVFCFS